MKASDKLSRQLKIYCAFHKPFAVPLPPYVFPVHGGRAISQAVPDMEGDDEGENISHLNPRMCELTVLYNVWKNKKYLPAQYWGLCHYRRYFILDAPWWKRKGEKQYLYFLKPKKKNFDRIFSARLSGFLLKHLNPETIIFPAPFFLAHAGSINVRDNFLKGHGEEGWEQMQVAITKLYPEYLKDFEIIGDQPECYFYNMMIAHYTVWEKFLPWLFDIVFYINENYSFSADPYQSGALGFMAERLLNVYFYHNRHHYRIVTMPVAEINPV